METGIVVGRLFGANMRMRCGFAGLHFDYVGMEWRWRWMNAFFGISFGCNAVLCVHLYCSVCDFGFHRGCRGRSEASTAGAVYG